ncbi:hypothetical protein EPI10_021338 [Gossypium australe]|uniref:Uncharacterized protein n=1 Tax=Gossypium australe TaxID=47621 RepID=A0A5B6WHZ1_9ROSI|nr:hypothetical protein EPI10_021338 [Gossypium australe]
MHKPLDSHFKAIKRILRYLQGTLDYGLHFTRSSKGFPMPTGDSIWMIVGLPLSFVFFFEVILCPRARESSRWYPGLQ